MELPKADVDKSIMATVLEKPLLTIKDLLVTPDEDGVDRWLIRGQLREDAFGDRDRWHAKTVATVGWLLLQWHESLESPYGILLGYGIGSILHRDPDTMVGMDTGFFGPETPEFVVGTSSVMDGPPILAVEILSSSEKKLEIDEKIDAYLDAGVKFVWIIDPHRKTVLVLRPDARPRLFNVTETIDAEPHLPGFSSPVAKIFE
jgi:hypothetical protein